MSCAVSESPADVNGEEEILDRPQAFVERYVPWDEEEEKAHVLDADDRERTRHVEIDASGDEASDDSSMGLLTVESRFRAEHQQRSWAWDKPVESGGLDLQMEHATYPRTPRLQFSRNVMIVFIHALAIALVMGQSISKTAISTVLRLLLAVELCGPVLRDEVIAWFPRVGSDVEAYINACVPRIPLSCASKCANNLIHLLE